MVKLLLKETSNHDKLANVIWNLADKTSVDSIEMALNVSKGFKQVIEVKSEDIANSTLNAFSKKDMIQWSFLDDYGMEYGGNSGLEKATQDCTLRIISLDKSNEKLVRLAKALEVGLRIKEDHAEQFAKSICSIVERNGVWSSQKLSIDVLAWTTANPWGSWAIFNSAKEILASNGGIAAANIQEEDKQDVVSKKSVTNVYSSKVYAISKTLVTELESLNKHYQCIEEENSELAARVNELLKERAELIAKLDVLSDKFIKLKSILD